MSNVLEAKKRSTERRSQLSELRMQGSVPAVVYGYNVENTPIFVNAAEFIKTMKEVGRNGVINLDMDGKKLNVILHEYQQDSLKNDIVHADFLVVDLTQEIEAKVRVETSEETAGVKDGGVLQVLLHELSVTAVPDQIPEVVEVDTTQLKIGESITVGDIRSNYSYTINHEDDEQVVNVQPPRVEADNEEVPADETAENNEE